MAENIKDWLKDVMYDEDVEWCKKHYAYDALEQRLSKLDKNSYKDSDIHEFLRDSQIVSESSAEHHRHWDEVSVIVKIKDKYIHFLEATTTTDYTAEECGWEFDWDQCFFVEPVEVMTIEYRRIA